MVFDVTRRADACVAGWTGYYGIPRASGICLRAVRRWAIMILVWACLHVSMEGGQHECVEISGSQDLPRQPNRNQGCALALIAKATDGKGPSVRRGIEVGN
jgi:hypothetical protein